MTDPQTIVHFGPDRRDPGGMARVIECYLETDVEPWRLAAVSTYTSSSRLRQLRHLISATATVLLRPKREMHGVHIHASERFDILRTTLFLEIARRRGLGRVVTIHGANFMTEVERSPKRVAAMLRRADVVTVLSQEVEAAAQRLGARAVRLLPNPIPLREAGTPGREIVFAGEIGRRKGVDVLLEAWRTVHPSQPDASLVLAGPPVEEALLDDLPAGVRFVGVLGREELTELLSRAYAAVLPSRAEAMPMFILEAMASGVPVVATPVGSVAWTLGGGGIVVPVGDPVALARALITLLEDSSCRNKLARRAHARAAQTFSTDVFAERVRELYASVFS